MALQMQEVELARGILVPWERQAPRDPRLLEQRTLVEFYAGAYGRAIELADQVLQRKPRDEQRWRNIRKAAVERLRQLQTTHPAAPDRSR